ncbi:MAG TPA: HK97 family phage prohead protease [Actinomycetota bacterium]|nr:HK97 family phage prohead protease [Actinomycetota bacterium]
MITMTRPQAPARDAMLYVTGRTAPTVAASRIVVGQIVPWDVPGRPTGYPGPVRFAAHSLDLESLADAPLLLDHEPSRPIGIVAGAWDTADELRASWRVADTQAGSDALTLVELGARSGLSVGAIVQDYVLQAETDTEVPELVVLSALVREVSLLTFPAYRTARASRP